MPAEVFELLSPKKIGALHEPGQDFDKELEKAIEKALEHKDAPKQ